MLSSTLGRIIDGAAVAVIQDSFILSARVNGEPQSPMR